MKRVRCAIYTRKSSEEGLEWDFNLLHAQREACAAYVLSQAREGWTLLPEAYDDGGISGGTLERPALQRLLADVAAGAVDNIVVYKVDRLTRSLLDFAKLVEAFDKAEVSFVSVPQSFNTTTSMGRLTLNMLLSFAQFEREVTAERIRDKIAASKAKGMWMGSTPPLGYRPDGRSLAIVEEHAAIVREIYARYLELGNVRRLADELERNGVRSPRRQRLTGTHFGGAVFSRGQLYAILKNPIYIVGSFNGRLRNECLNETLFTSLPHARFVLDAWRHDYNHVRPHSKLGGRTPADKAGEPVWGHAPDRSPSPQPTTMKEPDSTSDWLPSGGHVSSKCLKSVTFRRPQTAAKPPLDGSDRLPDAYRPLGYGGSRYATALLQIDQRRSRTRLLTGKAFAFRQPNLGADVQSLLNLPIFAQFVYRLSAQGVEW